MCMYLHTEVRTAELCMMSRTEKSSIIVRRTEELRNREIDPSMVAYVIKVDIRSHLHRLPPIPTQILGRSILDTWPLEQKCMYTDLHKTIKKKKKKCL